LLEVEASERIEVSYVLVDTVELELLTGDSILEARNILVSSLTFFEPTDELLLDMADLDFLDPTELDLDPLFFDSDLRDLKSELSDGKSLSLVECSFACASCVK